MELSRKEGRKLGKKEKKGIYERNGGEERNLGKKRKSSHVCGRERTMAS